MTDLIALKAANEKRWKAAKVTRNFAGVAARLVAPDAKARYLKVTAETGVPWAVIAVIHEREASQNWNTQLGQGDPLHAKSVHVPAGRGPFTTWEDGAVDALVHCPPFAARNKDWSIGQVLTELELYNGLGYAARGRPSPYVWSGTNQYVSGKYVRDGVYDPSVVDSQLGCAGLLMAMMSLDRSIGVGTAAAKTVVETTVPTSPKAIPSITSPAPGSIGSFIASIFTKIFGRK
jgi:lysozyme family protein